MITVYSKDYCPYCDLAKSLLKGIGVTFSEINITHDADAFEILQQKSHMMTVPQIFVDDELLGGYSDIAKLHEQGLLVKKLEGNTDITI